MPDIVIPIVFPDYKIAIPSSKISIPDLIPGFDLLPDTIETPGKVPELGHAGVLFISKSGTTKYFEYGRYTSKKGNVKKALIRDVKIGSDGHPTHPSLAYTLSQISAKSGHNGRIEGAYIEVSGKYEAMLAYAMQRLNNSRNPARADYDLFTNSCNHFMKGVLDAAGLKTPAMIDPRPNSYISELRDKYKDLDYSKNGHKLKIGDASGSLKDIFSYFYPPAAA